MKAPAIDVVNTGHGVATDAGTVRIERILPGPMERVWAYLTESDKRAQWLARGGMELRPGGRVDLHFRHAELSPEPGSPPERYRGMEEGHDSHGSILACEPPRLLRMTWGEETASPSEITFELSPEGDDVRLVLTHRRLSDHAGMRSVAGGWHAHLGILLDHLEGRTPPNFWKTHARLEREYGKLLAVSSSSD